MPEHMKYVKPIDPTPTWHLLHNNQVQTALHVSSLIETNKNSENSENYWFHIPGNPGHPNAHAYPATNPAGIASLTGPADP